MLFYRVKHNSGRNWLQILIWITKIADEILRFGHTHNDLLRYVCDRRIREEYELMYLSTVHCLDCII